MKRNLAIAFVIFTMAVDAMADGKMYWREEIPPKIPYQRALILFKNGSETLVLQSRYEVPKTDDRATLGWVVPVPAPPDVASMSADSARNLFLFLDMESRPRVRRIGPTLLAILFAGVGGVALFALRRGKLARFSLYALLICLLTAIIIPRFAARRGQLGVDVIAEHRVGIYDVRVVRADDPAGLISWLNANEFNFGQEDKTAFDAYISKEWCFVVAKIDPTLERDKREAVSEGLAAPLILRFPHESPVYPVALTGTGDHETEILIYLAADTKMSCDNHLSLRFAGELDTGSLEYRLPPWTEVDPEDFFNPEDWSYPYLCKFKDILTPAEMTQDIVFTPAGGTKDYREHIVKW